MNERIKELAIQSGLIAPYDSDHEGLRDFDYRKFAELIVRECIKLAAPEDSYRDEWFKAKCDVMDRIKQHFGVDE